jgi:hypothetical protein
LELLYQNTLDRAADSDGLSNWLQAMRNGLSRAEVPRGFSESLEHQIKVYSAWQDNGIIFSG